MNRRAFLGTLAASAALSPISGITTLPRRPLIGFLAANSKAAGGQFHSGFPHDMRELGYVDGRDYVFEDRYADGDFTRLPLWRKSWCGSSPT